MLAFTSASNDFNLEFSALEYHVGLYVLSWSRLSLTLAELG